MQELLDNLKDTHPKVVEELVPHLLPLGAVAAVFLLDRSQLFLIWKPCVSR